jgi:hypothetical protein
MEMLAIFTSLESLVPTAVSDSLFPRWLDFAISSFYYQPFIFGII